MKPLLLGVLAMLMAMPARASEDWQMAGRNPAHSSHVSTGPSSPLKKSWVAKTDAPLGSFTPWPIVEKGTVFAFSAGGVIAVEAATGKKLWWQDTQGAKQVALASSGTQLYVPLPEGTVAALSSQTGSVEWRVQMGETGLADPSPTLADGRLFFGRPDEKAFYALRAGDGGVLWTATTEFFPDSVPAVSENIVVFSTGEVDSSRVLLLALDVETGNEIWRAEQKEANSSPSILGDKVILGGGDFFAYALDLKTGTEIWKSPVEDKFSVRNMPALAFGDVFLADRIGNIYRLDGETGKRKWIFRDTEGTMDQSFPVIAGKTLFIGSSAGNLYALDTETGRLLWTDHVDGIVLSGAADSERFYFGVKLGKDEGLHAYGHDPQGELLKPPSRLREVEPLIGGLILVGLVFVAIILFTRRRRVREREPASS